MRLRDELKIYGYLDSEDEFKDILREVFCTMFPAWVSEEGNLNDEELACNVTSDATRYVHAIRARTHQGIPDRLIMRALQGLRKRRLEMRDT